MTSSEFPLLFMIIWLFALIGLVHGRDDGGMKSPAKDGFMFYHTEGSRILDEAGCPAALRGVAFGNEVWSDNVRIPQNHHGETDYRRVRDMGMNLVRFYLNYRTLEDDAHPYEYRDDGWAWIDRNIEWAREAGVYLILNFHVPQGGFQSLAQGGALWEQPELQDRLAALWVAIAERYKNEPVVFGYDLVNEPGVTRGKDQWQKLAQRLCDRIREVDKNHPVIVERVNSIKGQWTSDKDNNFFLIRGDNIIYTFHFYDPFDYTHQYAFWTPSTKGKEGGAWHDGRFERSKKYLRQQLDKQSAWARKHDVPLYLGEWGLYKPCFEQDRNGLAWVNDMIDLIDESGWMHTYHTYHEESFGIYRGGGKVDPINANHELIELFRSRWNRVGSKQ